MLQTVCLQRTSTESREQTLKTVLCGSELLQMQFIDTLKPQILRKLQTAPQTFSYMNAPEENTSVQQILLGDNIYTKQYITNRPNIIVNHISW